MEAVLFIDTVTLAAAITGNRTVREKRPRVRYASLSLSRLRGDYDFSLSRENILRCNFLTPALPETGVPPDSSSYICRPSAGGHSRRLARSRDIFRGGRLRNAMTSASSSIFLSRLRSSR